MARDNAFIEYALFGYLEGMVENDGLIPVATIRVEELRRILGVDRLRPERIEAIRSVCEKIGIGYAVIGSLHYFFLPDGLSGRMFEKSELDHFIQGVEEFSDVYGSAKAEEIYQTGSYTGVYNPPQSTSSLRQVRGRKTTGGK